MYIIKDIYYLIYVNGFRTSSTPCICLQMPDFRTVSYCQKYISGGNQYMGEHSLKVHSNREKLIIYKKCTVARLSIWAI